MNKYIEFCDTGIDVYVSAVDALNKFISENKHLKVSVIGYLVLNSGQDWPDRTYILAEVEE